MGQIDKQIRETLRERAGDMDVPWHAWERIRSGIPQRRPWWQRLRMTGRLELAAVALVVVVMVGVGALRRWDGSGATTERVPSGAPEAGPALAKPGVTPPASTTSTPQTGLTVEEYPLTISGPNDKPTSFEFRDQVPKEIFEKRTQWREISMKERRAAANAVITKFGYGLKDGTQTGTSDLYRQNQLAVEGIQHVFPVSVNAKGDDFAMLAETGRGYVLVSAAEVRTWDHMKAQFTPPVMVGDQLVWVEAENRSGTLADAQETYVIMVGGQPSYRVTTGANPVGGSVKSLTSWDGHWVLEVNGMVYVDGKNLTRELSYDEMFGYRLVGGLPFYFFRQGEKIGYSYGGMIMPRIYDEVPRYRCCEPAYFNPAGNENMVWFWGRKGDTWHYVEMGLFDK